MAKIQVENQEIIIPPNRLNKQNENKTTINGIKNHLLAQSPLLTFYLILHSLFFVPLRLFLLKNYHLKIK